MTHTLAVDSVMFTRKEKKILRGAYLSCQTGETVGLLGLNGCGKSTLLKMIFGSVTADSGTILIDKQWVDKPFKKGNLVSYLPQESFLPSHSKVKQVINLFVPDRSNRAKLFANPRIQSYLNKKVNVLSGGELRYLEVNLILNLNVYFVLLDEPFTGIEPLYIESMKEVINQTKDKGIIITDHLYQNILDISDRLVLMKDGRTHPLQNKQELKTMGYIPDQDMLH